MGNSVANFLVLVAALVQAMPAGVCCLPKSAERSAGDAVKLDAPLGSAAPSCCRSKAASAAAAKLAPSAATHCSTPGPQRAPVSPSFHCCCTNRVATPETPVRLPDATVEAPAVAVLPTFTPRVELGALSVETRPPGPPVRILLGVWRC